MQALLPGPPLVTGRFHAKRVTGVVSVAPPTLKAENVEPPNTDALTVTVFVLDMVVPRPAPAGHRLSAFFRFVANVFALVLGANVPDPTEQALVLAAGMVPELNVTFDAPDADRFCELIVLVLTRKTYAPLATAETFAFVLHVP